MATHIKSLSNAVRTAKQVLANNPVSKRVRKNGKPVEPLKGKPAKIEATRRKTRDAAKLLQNIVTLRAAKKLAGNAVKRECKVVYPENLFAGMTPRQVKHLKKRPKDIETIRQAKVSALLTARVAEEQLIDEKRAHRARQKAAAKVRAIRAREAASAAHTMG